MSRWHRDPLRHRVHLTPEQHVRAPSPPPQKRSVDIHNKKKQRKAFFSFLIFFTFAAITYIANHRNKQLSTNVSEAIHFNVIFNQNNLDRFGQMKLHRTFVEDRTDEVATPRLLIAQYDYGSSYLNNSYVEIIKSTSKVNKAYARKWNHDYLLARGVFISTSPGKSYLTWGRKAAGSTSNKVGILEYALQHPTKKWDYVLLLDSDAMIYDFELDIAEYYNMTNVALIAHRVWYFDTYTTHNINAGVMLWNLKYNLSSRIILDWDKNIHQVFETKVGEDQEALQNVLWRMPWRNRPIRAIRKDFEYSRGTVVKHFIRQGSKAVRLNWDDTLLNSEDRIQLIITTADSICKQYKEYCDDVKPE